MGEFINEEEQNKFILKGEGWEAYIKYFKRGNILYLVKTVVPNDQRNKGVGSCLIENSLNFAKSNNLKIIPTCPFVSRFLQRNDIYFSLIAG